MVLFRILTILLFFQASSQADCAENPVEIVRSLVSPEKLESLKHGNRAANSRFRKAMYWAFKAEQAGKNPKLFFNEVYSGLSRNPYANSRHVYAPQTERINLEANYRLGRLYGIYSGKNLDLLRQGKSPIITRGEYRSEKLHVDHILPASIYPELENCLANLRWLPAPLNLSKNDKETNVSKRRRTELMRETGWDGMAN